MEYYTFKQLALDIIQEADKPLTPTEIWNRACSKGLHQKLPSYGKTPIATLSACIYTDCKSQQPNFIQVSKRPSLFIMKHKEAFYSEVKIQETKDNLYSTTNNYDECSHTIANNIRYCERDLHILLSTFVKYSQDFKCHTKTIYHEKSKKSKAGRDIWVYPDMIGVYYPYDDYRQETLELKKLMKEKSIKLFSFELKIALDQANMRTHFFQTVSNSSWAHEGYLIALEINQDVKEDLRKLSNAFGIGVIQLNPSNIYQSEVLFPAREKFQLDYDALDRLVDNNHEFKRLLQDIIKDSDEFHNSFRGLYDTYFDDEEEVRTYCHQKGIL